MPWEKVSDKHYTLKTHSILVDLYHEDGQWDAYTTLAIAPVTTMCSTGLEEAQGEAVANVKLMLLHLRRELEEATRPAPGG